MFLGNMVTKLTIGWFSLLLIMKLIKTITDFINEGFWFPNVIQFFVFLIFCSVVTFAIYGLIKNKLSAYYFSISINVLLAVAGILGVVGQIYILSYPEVYFSEPVFWTLLLQCLVSTLLTFFWVKRGKTEYKKT